MPSPSHKKCMEKGCDKPPEHETIWADGRGRAWFCEKHWDDWFVEDEDGNAPTSSKGFKAVVKHRKVKHGEVGKKYGEEPGKPKTAFSFNDAEFNRQVRASYESVLRVARNHVVIQKVAGWWAIDPVGGTGQVAPWSGQNGLANEITGPGPDEDKRYNGDGPADIMDAAMADIDMAYRQSWGRPAYPEELQAVWDFCFGPYRREGVGSDTWPENKWVDEAAERGEVSQDVIVALPKDALKELEDKHRRMRNSGIDAQLAQGEFVSNETGFPEPTKEGVAEWWDVVAATLWWEQGQAERVLGIKQAHDGYPYKADQRVVVGPYVDDQNPETRFYKPGIVRGDPGVRETLDGDVLVDIEGEGRQQADPDEIMAEDEWAKAYPDRPFPTTQTEDIPLEVSASRVAMKFAALVGTDTAEVVALDPGQLAKLIDEGEWREAWAASPGSELCDNLIRMHGGAAFLTGGDGDFDVEIPDREGHLPIVSEEGHRPPYATSEYSDTDSFMEMARRVTTRFAKHEWQTGDGSGVWTGFRVPEPYSEQFPDLGDEDNSPPHITFLYLGEVDPKRSDELVSIIQDVMSTAKAVRAQHMGLDYFEQPDREGRCAIDRVRFSHDLAGYRDRLRSALEDAGFDVADSFVVFQPHTTLEYLDGADTAFDGGAPQGSWLVEELEVWGLPEVHTIRLGIPHGDAMSMAMFHRTPNTLARGA